MSRGRQPDETFSGREAQALFGETFRQFPSALVHRLDVFQRPDCKAFVAYSQADDVLMGAEVYGPNGGRVLIPYEV